MPRGVLSTSSRAASKISENDTTEDLFRLTCSGFHDGGHIPRKYASGGKGDDVAPPLQWTGLPEGTESLAIIMEDVDAPDPEAPIAPFTHWVVANIPATLHGLPEGFTTKSVEEGSELSSIQEGVNDFKVPHYKGPLPPTGTHRYVITAYALDSMLKLGSKVTKEKLQDAMADHILAEASLTGHHSNEKMKGHATQYRSPGQHENPVAN
jgi:Raf kinase inhibitor-like YbhB/YbcL family protein